MKAIIKSAAIAATFAFAGSVFAADGTNVTIGEGNQIQNAVNSEQIMDLGSIVGKKQNGKTTSKVIIDRVTQKQSGTNNHQFMVVGRNDGEFATETYTNVYARSLYQDQTGGANSVQAMKIGNVE
jgi:hypothetical protein